MPFSQSQSFLCGRRKFGKIRFSLGELKRRLTWLLPATCSSIPLLAKSEFHSRFPGRLLEVGSPQLSAPPPGTWTAAKGEEEHGVGNVRALCMPGQPLAVRRFSAELSKRLAAKHNENAT